MGGNSVTWLHATNAAHAHCIQWWLPTGIEMGTLYSPRNCGMTYCISPLTMLANTDRCYNQEHLTGLKLPTILLVERASTQANEGFQFWQSPSTAALHATSSSKNGPHSPPNDFGLCLPSVLPSVVGGYGNCSTKNISRGGTVAISILYCSRETYSLQEKLRNPGSWSGQGYSLEKLHF